MRIANNSRRSSRPNPIDPSYDRRFVASDVPRDPRMGVVVFLGLILLGCVAYFGIRNFRQSSSTVQAVSLARLYRLRPTGPALAQGVVNDAAVDPRRVEWRMVGVRGVVYRVAAVARKGKEKYEYRFDVDLETSKVLPANPRAERVFAASQTGR